MLEDFLKQALQLEKLYAAAHCECAPRDGRRACRLVGGNELSCGTDTRNCGYTETLTIRSRVSEMYASVSAGTAANPKDIEENA